MPGAAPGFQHALQFFLRNETRLSCARRETLGYLLAHILPGPVMLLAANRKSTAVGVRPRGKRIEVTADFTPDAALMLATCAFIAGVAECRAPGRITNSRSSRRQDPALRVVPIAETFHRAKAGE